MSKNLPPQNLPAKNLTAKSVRQRREFLQLGLSCTVGGLAQRLLAGEQRTPSGNSAGMATANPIRSCILVMYYGGPSHVDTWDMKPDAASEVRGEFRSISTNVPGRFVCEHLPQTSQVMDKLAVIRSMHHPMTNHNAAMYEALIGRLPTGGNAELLAGDRTVDFPNHGAVLSYLVEQGQLPPGKNPLTNVALPHVMHNVVRLAGQNAGYFDARYDPFQIERDPNAPDFRIRELELLQDVPAQRLNSRRQLLQELDNAASHSPRQDALWQNHRRAYELIGTTDVQAAFDIDSEQTTTRDRYGRNRLGQSMLLARRLVEHGVRFINVNDKIYNGQLANWDSHQDNFARHKNDLLPPADQAFSALIQDLDQRGLLDSTLVIAMGEFGRTPKINATAGRDHWPDCYSVVLAGGGVQGGSTHGASDPIGAYPDSQAVTPGDLAATIFWRFGVDYRQELIDPFDRPHRMAHGEPIRELF
jgi:hypothetical protein